MRARGSDRAAVGVPLALLALVLLPTGCSRESAGERVPAAAEPRRGGTAVLGSISDVDSWNEYLSHQTFAHDLLGRIFPPLARKIEGGPGGAESFRPELAESWTTSDDGLAITFRLREASWSDGAPVTASDVRFTWRAQTSPDVVWADATSKEHVDDVEVVDDRTVTFHFDRVYPQEMEDAVVGGILPEHEYGRVPFDQWRNHDWSTLHIGGGPFVLESHSPGDEIVLARNPRYFAPDLPRLDRIVVRVVPDAGNLLTQLLAGDVDYTENVAPWEAERVRAAPGVTLIPFDAPRFDYIGWNGAHPPFDDPLIRRALTLAIDRRGLVEELLHGFGRISTGPVPSFVRGADPAIAPWPYDPDEARRLLGARGFLPGRDGVLERDGHPLELTLTTNAGNRLREAVLVKVQEQLGRIGVRVEVRPLEMRTFVQANLAGHFDAYVGGWSVSGRILKELFGSASRPPRGSNVVAYASPEVDRLLDRLDEARTWHDALPVLHAIERRIHEDQPYTFLYETRRLAAVGPRLRGVTIDSPSDPLAHLERDWVVP
jgi:peptide/nickel transport system substrate-binding protein